MNEVQESIVSICGNDHILSFLATIIGVTIPLGALVYYFSNRWIFIKRKLSKSDIHVLERKMLAYRTAVYIVRVRNKDLLLFQTPNQLIVESLSEKTPQTDKDEAIASNATLK